MGLVGGEVGGGVWGVGVCVCVGGGRVWGGGEMRDRGCYVIGDVEVVTKS